jgi:PAS domain S-box-containing protein
MKSLLRSLSQKLLGLSPGTFFGLGLCYVLVVAALDFFTPTPMSISFFYVLASMFVGWRAGKWRAAIISTISVGLLTLDEWSMNRAASQAWLLTWNTLSRWLVFMVTGWMTAEASRLNRDLGRLVEERTARWKVEAEEHKSTSSRLADALAEGKRTMLELAKAQANLEHILSHNPAISYTCQAAPPYAATFVSQNVRAHFGHEPQQFTSAPEFWLEQVHPDDRSAIESALVRLFSEGDRAYEYRFRHKNGQYRWVLDHAKVVRDADGAILDVVGFMLDITERKRSEFLLQAQRDLGVSLSLANNLDSALNRLLELAVQMEGLDCGGVYLLDAATEGLHLAAHRGLSNDFVADVSYCGPDSGAARLIRAGKPVYDLQEKWRCSEQLTNSGEGLRSLAVLPLCHDGKVLGALNLASHVEEEVPAQTRMVIEAIATQAAGAIARLRVAEALQQSEMRLRTIITGAPIIVFSGDRTGAITFQTGQSTRTSTVASPSTALTGLAAESRFPIISQNVHRVLKGEEFSAVVKVGSDYFDCWYSPTRDREETISGYIGVATNITERYRLERQILEICDREQARLGQDIHDGLCQQLVSLAFDANSLEQCLSLKRRGEAARAKRLATLLDQAISEARQLARGLFPVRLDAEGLASALEELATSTRERFRVRCHFEMPEPVSIRNNAMATHLYRIAQEAVNNAVRHGQALAIGIRLQATDHQVELIVEDNGKGLPTERSAKFAGMGLHIMDYRARSMGGAFQIRLRPGGGTAVSCCVTRGPG